MKRVPLRRRTPLTGGSPLPRGTGLRQGGSLTRRVPLKAEPGKATSRRTPRDTGPSPATRAQVRGRDLGWCVRCGKAVANSPRSVHHRVKRSHGVDNSPQNLVTLCGTGTTDCHGWVHAHPADARVRGWMLTEGDDPAKVPVAVAVAPGEYMTFWLLPDGERTTDRPEGAAA